MPVNESDAEKKMSGKIKGEYRREWKEVLSANEEVGHDDKSAPYRPMALDQ